MKINFDFAKFLLWAVTAVVVLFVWMFLIFFACGILMAVFQVKDSLVLMVHTYFSLPLSVVCAACFIAKKRDLLAAFIDANTGRK